jgi:ERF superfamily protein
MSDQTQAPARRLPLVPGPGKIAGLVVQPTTAATPVKENGQHPSPKFGPVGEITKAVASVMKKVGTIPKRGHNKFHNYNYALVDDVLDALTPLMGEAGLCIWQNQLEIKNIEGNRVVVLYEFTVTHESGQVSIPLCQPGSATARDSKGNWDDKCLAKCHTQARKYFLLSLFQVPAGDFPDSDNDDANQRPASRPVPGPKSAPQQAAPRAPEQESAGAIDPAEGPPQRLQLPQGTTAQQFAEAYIRCIGKAKTIDELGQWDKLNDDVLQRISDRYSPIYDTIKAAVDNRVAAISPAHAMPDPKKDPQESMNWIAGQLQQFTSYEAGEAFWNQVVAPHEQEFDQVDWDMLMREWSLFEQRFPLEQDPTEPK